MESNQQARQTAERNLLGQLMAEMYPAVQHAVVLPGCGHPDCPCGGTNEPRVIQSPVFDSLTN